MREWWQRFWGAPFAMLAIPVGTFMMRGFYALYWLVPWYDPKGEPDAFIPGALALGSTAAVLITAGIIVNGVVNAPPRPKTPKKPCPPAQTDWRGE